MLIGAQKAGTTSLAAWLQAHPDVFVAPEKEVRYFNDPYRFWLGPEWYRAQFAGWSGERIVCDATPLMSNPVAVGHMADALPHARLVAVLRHPVERAYSQDQHLRAQGLERRSFRRALQDERREPEGARGRVPRDYLHRSRYDEQIGRVLARYPTAALHIVLFEDLVGDPAATYTGLCRFLGIDDVRPAGLGSAVDPRPSFHSPLLHRGIGAAERRRWLPPGIAHRLRRLNEAPPRRYPPLDAGLRRELVEELRPDVVALSHRLGRDLSAWLA
jgi:hypothetical protein